jgi:hypothetical protein
MDPADAGHLEGDSLQNTVTSPETQRGGGEHVGLMISIVFHSCDPRNGSEKEKTMPGTFDPLSRFYFQFSSE